MRIRRLWNNCCPHCGLDFDVQSHWDYQTEFIMDCPHCQKRIHVKVESVPEFGLAKAEEVEAADKQKRFVD